MNKLNDQFLIKNYEEARTNKESIILGKHYRISILSDVLVRIEWSNEGKFEDRPTELVKFRNFQPPKYFIKEDKDYLTVSKGLWSVVEEKGWVGGLRDSIFDWRFWLAKLEESSSLLFEDEFDIYSSEFSLNNFET